MFNIYTLLILVAGSLFAADLILVASRSASKVKPDWKTAVISGGAGMLASEAFSFISWQFTSTLVGMLGEGPASWLSVVISAIVGSLVSARIIYRRFGMGYWKAYSKSLIGIIPAFILYSLLLGLFTGLMGK